MGMLLVLQVGRSWTTVLNKQHFDLLPTPDEKLRDHWSDENESPAGRGCLQQVLTWWITLNSKLFNWKPQTTTCGLRSDWTTKPAGIVLWGHFLAIAVEKPPLFLYLSLYFSLLFEQQNWLTWRKHCHIIASDYHSSNWAESNENVYRMLKPDKETGPPGVT